MAVALTTVPTQAIEAPSWSREKLDLIKKTIFDPDGRASDAQFELFMATARRLGLDPIAKQITAFRQGDRYVTIVTIDGFRATAEATGQYRGQTPAQWCGQDGVWRDVWLEDGPPAAARVGVHREGWAAPVYGVATLRSYAKLDRNGRPQGNWDGMPDIMLSKCAEALAIRKTFPVLSGVYTSEEMDQASNGPTYDAPQQLQRGPSEAFTTLMAAIAAAGTLRELQDTWPATQRLRGAERDRAVAAGNDKAAQLNAAAEPKPTDETPVDKVRAAILGATSEGELAEAVEGYKLLDAAERESLRAAYKTKAESLEAAKVAALEAALESDAQPA